MGADHFKIFPWIVLTFGLEIQSLFGPNVKYYSTLFSFIQLLFLKACQTPVMFIRC